MGCSDSLRNPRMRWCWLTITFLGLAMVGVGVAIGVFVPNMFVTVLKGMFIIDSNTSSGYASMVSQTYSADDGSPVSVYLYHLTNPAAVAAGTAAPDFREKGPYIYRSAGRAVKAEFLEDGTKIKTVGRSLYLPVTDGTSADDTEELTLINPVYLGVMAQAGSEQNLFLGVGLVSTAVSTIVAGFDSSAFRTPVLVGGTAYILDQVWLRMNSSGLITNLYDYWGKAAAANALMPKDMYVGMLLSGTSPGFADSEILAAWAIMRNAQTLGAFLHNRTAVAVDTMTDAEKTMMYNWIGYYMAYDAPAQLAAQFGIRNSTGGTGGIDLTDLPYAQWANCIPAGGTASSATLPEWCAWAATKGYSAITFTVAQAKVILTKLSQSAKVIEYFEAMQLSNVTWLVAELGINPATHAGPLWQYVHDHVQNELAVAQYKQTLSGDSGLFATKRARDFIFGGLDTLYTMLVGAAVPADGVFKNQSTVQQALTANSRKVKWTGKGDISRVGQIIEVNGKSTVDIWASPVAIEGTSGGQFEPFTFLPASLEPIVWSGDVMRPIHFAYKEMELLDGILPTARYELAQDELFSVNPKFYNTIPGFINGSAINGGIPFHFSLVHMTDSASRVYRRNFTLTVDSGTDVEEEHPFYLNVVPFLGTTVRADNSMQINTYIDATWKAKLALTAPGLKSGSMFPVGYMIQGGSATTSQLGAIKSQLSLRTMALSLLPGLVVPGGILLVIGISLVGYSVYASSSRRDQVVPVKMRDEHEMVQAGVPHTSGAPFLAR